MLDYTLQYKEYFDEAIHLIVNSIPQNLLVITKNLPALYQLFVFCDLPNFILLLQPLLALPQALVLSLPLV